MFVKCECVCVCMYDQDRVCVQACDLIRCQVETAEGALPGLQPLVV